MDKSKKVENTIDILFAEDDETELFSGSNIDGKNVIQQNNELSLCDRALDICCHRKTIELHKETVIETTTKSTTITTLESTLVSKYIIIVHTLGTEMFAHGGLFMSKMPMFQRVGMKEGGRPLPLAFQYLILMI